MDALYGAVNVSALYVAKLVACGVAGLVVGWAYFRVMKRSLTYLGKGRNGTIPFVSMVVLRILLFGGGVLATYLMGPWCLVAHMLGFILARTLVVSRAREECDL